MSAAIWCMSCELLSNHYLCANKNSISFNTMLQHEVVNCFQIIIFVLTRTAVHHLAVVVAWL